MALGTDVLVFHLNRDSIFSSLFEQGVLIGFGSSSEKHMKWGKCMGGIVP